MFCFQCEQTAGGAGCTRSGVCGKKPGTALLQDKLVGELVALAAGGNYTRTPELDALVENALFTTLTNVNFDDLTLAAMVEKVSKARKESGVADAWDMEKIWTADEDIRSLKSLLLFGMKGIAAYASHARVLGRSLEEVNDFLYRGLALLASDAGKETLLDVVMEAGKVNLACMELLHHANRTYGTPVPVTVSRTVEKGPFIIVSGHDLHDLAILLRQTEGKGVNIYTHGEMLPAHAYPELKKYAHFKGHFGTAWQNQQKEFAGVPAPVLFTTNCIMPVKDSYADRVFTTGVVQYPGMTHIGDDKDFSPVIAKALELGGYAEDTCFSGINGGETVTTGFGSEAVLSHAGTIVEAVKAGAIRHFFLVGGCDGAKPGRNYYTEFVKNTPADTVVLTLACGKFRFNDLDIGSIGGIPRLLDMGQCNDAYGAIQVALALAEAFHCGVNDLPLTMVLSWYEQKAVAILLTLLYLGVKNMYLGPSLPAFVSPAVLDFLVKEFGVRPISSPEADMAAALAR
ncbi:hydroxylamine reductase [Mailhella sp.]|uniref:hydroxylamine reductase n=1 Tax=Mailhella sp. TaxID=1981029 RepID=UPI003AB8E829